MKRTFEPGRWRKRPRPVPALRIRKTSEGDFQRLVRIVDDAAATMRERNKDPAHRAGAIAWLLKAGVGPEVLRQHGIEVPPPVVVAA